MAEVRIPFEWLKCANCGNPLKDASVTEKGDLKCPNCGSESEIFCFGVGSLNEGDAR